MCHVLWDRHYAIRNTEIGIFNPYQLRFAIMIGMCHDSFSAFCITVFGFYLSPRTYMIKQKPKNSSTECYFSENSERLFYAIRKFQSDFSMYFGNFGATFLCVSEIPERLSLYFGPNLPENRNHEMNDTSLYLIFKSITSHCLLGCG